MYPFKVKPLIKIVGLLLIIEAIFMLTALPFSIYYDENDLLPILESSLITLTIGLIMWFLRRNYKEREIGMREGYLIVLGVWIIISVFGALPYYISGAIPHYTDAFFETMSGFSTTGASILTDIEVIPKGLLFWRAMTHWLGGMGIIVLTIAILPFLGFGGMALFFAEVPGVEKEKLSPRIKNTARSLWGIYTGLTVAMVIMLMLGGMNFFESICHAFAALATGGFSPKNTSLADYSPYIQYVAIAFMFLAGTNFTLHYLALKGKLRKAISGVEYKTYVSIILVSSLIIAIALIFQRNYDTEHAIRSALFNVVSIISCTGFANEDFMLWPDFTWLILFLLMFVGGMAGSTSGSIKVIRWVVLFKNLRLSLRQLVHSSGVFRVRIDGRALKPDSMQNVLAIFFLYLLTFFIGTLILTYTGLDFVSSMGSVATCMGGIGPGLKTTGPVANYAHLSDLAKWTLSFLMLLGRLELFSVFVTWSSSFWKN